MRVREWAPQEVKCGPILGPMPAFEAESRVQLFLLIKGGVGVEASNPQCFWKPEQGMVASDTNAQNSWCCCFKETRKSFSGGRELKPGSWSKEENLRRKGDRRREILSYMNLHNRWIRLRGGRRLEISKIENIFFGTNPVYELKPKQGTDDLILRNSSWLWLRKIKTKTLTIDRICGSVFHLNRTNRRNEAFTLHCWAELEQEGGSQTLSLEWGILSPAVRLTFSLQRAGCCGLNIRCPHVPTLRAWCPCWCCCFERFWKLQVEPNSRK